MGLSRSDKVIIIGVSIPDFVLFLFQTVGLFTTHWASNVTCDSIGLVYSCCNGRDNNTCISTQGVDVLDVRVLVLQAVSFVFTIHAVLCSIGSILVSCLLTPGCDTVLATCVTGCAVCCVTFAKFFGVFLHAVAGLCSVIGCIIAATKFSTSELGYSFYLCLTAGCMFLLLSVIVIVLVATDRFCDCDCDCDCACDCDAESATEKIGLRRFYSRSSENRLL